MPRLTRGDLPPKIVVAPPGPRARALCRRLARLEPPGANTLPTGGGATLLWQEACGANVLDVDGNRYVDLTSGFGAAAIGHRHPEVVAAVRRQAGVLLHGLGDVHAHPGRVELAARLARLAPVADPRVFFAVSGADAVEIALKSALLSTGRPGIVAFDPAYHGTSLGALAVSSRPAFRHPFAAHLHPHVHRLPYGASAERIESLLGEPRARIGAVILEPVAGREGVILPPAGWLASVADRCRAHRTLLIADEVLTGLGRTGRWFAVEAEGVRPDLLCCGKALGGGLPIAAVVGRSEVMAAWDQGGETLHTGTFLAQPVAVAAALATLEILRRERLPARAARLGRRLAPRLASWGRFPAVAEVRGRGLLWGVELVSAGAAGRLVAGAMRRGVLLLAGGPEGRVAQILPPLAIAEAQLEGALEIVEGVLEGVSPAAAG